MIRLGLHKKLLIIEQSTAPLYPRPHRRKWSIFLAIAPPELGQPQNSHTAEVVLLSMFNIFRSIPEAAASGLLVKYRRRRRHGAKVMKENQ